MEQKKILIGFDDPTFENGVISYLKTIGCNAESTVKLTKASIRDFLIANPSYDTAVLLEVMNNSKSDIASKYTAEELALLTDERDINIVIILNSNHKGTVYMETLYKAGITSAFYQKGRKGGATPKEIANLIMNKRCRREARVYYGLGEAPLKVGFLGNDTFEEYYNCLNDVQHGTSVLERFINVCSSMSPAQVADFIRRMPADVLGDLKQYEEFFTIVDLLKISGVNIHIKKPKKLKIGLVTPENMNAVTNQLADKGKPAFLEMNYEQENSPVEEPIFNNEDKTLILPKGGIEENSGTMLESEQSNDSVEESFFEAVYSIWGANKENVMDCEQSIDEDMGDAAEYVYSAQPIRNDSNHSVDGGDRLKHSIPIARHNETNSQEKHNEALESHIGNEVEMSANSMEDAVGDFINNGKKKVKLKKGKGKKDRKKIKPHMFNIGLTISLGFIVLSVLLILIGIIVLLV